MNDMVDNYKPELRAKNESPQRWWQWLLLYPAFTVAIVGAVPTYIEAFKSHKLGVAFGQSFDANEQNRLWQENFECTKKANILSTVNKKRVEIGSVVCESGDILLTGKRPEWDQPQLRWVSWAEVAPSQTDTKKSHLLLDIIKTASASELAPVVLAQAAASSVICQRWMGAGQLRQRVRTTRGCFDQVVNTYKGWVVDSRPAPCNPAC